MEIKEAIHNLELCLQYQDYIPLEEISLLLEFIKQHQWQPIETAPKDGSAILTCNAPHYETNGFLPVAVRWRCYQANSKGKEEFRDSSGIKIRTITHWMPLPQPPKDEK